MMRWGKREGNTKRQLTISLLLAFVALASVSAVSVAWFTIADFTKVHSMSMEITSGNNLRFDLDPHEEIDQYVHTLRYADIARRVQRDLGYDMREVPLEPVTTKDVITFTYEDGKEAAKESGVYQEFVLHFMASKDMLVHLTSKNSKGKRDGTGITSANPKLPEAMRISFTVNDKTFIYDPGMGDESKTDGSVVYFGLPDGEHMVLSDKNALFTASKDEDIPVLVHVWLEGTDASCTDEVREAEYSITLRFEGTDMNHQPLETEER